MDKPHQHLVPILEGGERHARARRIDGLKDDDMMTLLAPWPPLPWLVIVPLFFLHFVHCQCMVPCEPTGHRSRDKTVSKSGNTFHVM